MQRACTRCAGAPQRRKHPRPVRHQGNSCVLQRTTGGVYKASCKTLQAGSTPSVKCNTVDPATQNTWVLTSHQDRRQKLSRSCVLETDRFPITSYQSRREMVFRSSVLVGDCFPITPARCPFACHPANRVTCRICSPCLISSTNLSYPLHTTEHCSACRISSTFLLYPLQTKDTVAPVVALAHFCCTLCIQHTMRSYRRASI